MRFRTLVLYYDVEGKRRQYGCFCDPMILAHTEKEAIEKVIRALPSQVAKTWFEVQVVYYHGKDYRGYERYGEPVCIDRETWLLTNLLESTLAA